MFTSYAGGCMGLEIISQYARKLSYTNDMYIDSFVEDWVFCSNPMQPPASGVNNGLVLQEGECGGVCPVPPPLQMEPAHAASADFAQPQTETLVRHRARLAPRFRDAQQECLEVVRN